MPAVDPVILQLRAEVKQYQNEIRATTTLVNNQLDRQERSILSLENTVERSTARIGDRFAAMGQRVSGFLSGIALGAIISQLASLADESKQLEGQLRLATASFGTFGQAQADVQRIADTTRSSLEATTKLYAGFVRASQETGRSQEDAARATQTFAEALKIGGAGTEEAASATLQFNQALQSGVLRGDEFNSIMEASPRIARLLAQALGVPIGQLRAMAEQGQITSDVLFRALTDRKFTAGIDAEFKQVPVTFGDAMQAVENAAVTTFGKFDQGGQFSNAIVAFLGTGTDSFRSLTERAEQFGIDTRAVFDGLANVFDPIGANGNSVFDALGIRIYSVRDQIASLLDSLDTVANFDTKIENSIKRGLNRAIDRAGGGQKFQETPLQNLGGRFRQGDRLSAARGRREAAVRRLEAQGYIVPRNEDGTVNEAGIVRRPAAPRVRIAAPPSKPAKVSRARGGGASRAKVDDVPDVAELMKAISQDLQNISIDAGSAMKPESERLDRAASHFESIFGKEGRDYANPFAGADQYREDAKARADAADEAERRSQDIRERNVYQVASLYESLFQEGTDGIWRNFKDQGLRTLALIAAQATIASFSKGGGGFGSLIGNIGKAFSSFQGGGFGGLFGRASGGYVPAGGMVRVNEGRSTGVELLRMGSQGGTVIPLGATSAQPATGGGNRVFHIQVDARNSVTPAGFADQLSDRILRQAAQMDVDAGKTTLRQTPGYVATARRFGGPRTI